MSAPINVYGRDGTSRSVEPIYRRGVWAAIPCETLSGYRCTDCAVVHVPSGIGVGFDGYTDMPTSDDAINLCRALADEFPVYAAAAVFGTNPMAGDRVMARWYADWLGRWLEGAR